MLNTLKQNLRNMMRKKYIEQGLSGFYVRTLDSNYHIRNIKCETMDDAIKCMKNDWRSVCAIGPEMIVFLDDII